MRFIRAPNWCPSGGGGTQEAGSNVAESLVGHRSMRKCTVARSVRRVSTKFGESGEQLDRRRAQKKRIRCMREP